MTRIAGPPYRAESQWHGPCYVLDPDDYAQGWREVIAVILAIPRRLKRQRIYAISRRVATQETRTVVAWHKGRPWDTYLKVVPVLRREPGWHTRARELHARGLSVRAVMRELGIKSQSEMQRVLGKTAV